MEIFSLYKMNFLAAMSDDEPTPPPESVTQSQPAQASYTPGKLSYQHGAMLLGVPPSTYRLWCHHFGGKFPTIAEAVRWIQLNVDYVLRPLDEAWNVMVDILGEPASHKMCGGERGSVHADRVPKHLQRVLSRNPAGNAARRQAIGGDDEDEEDDSALAGFDSMLEEEMESLMADPSIEGRIQRTRLLERKIFRMSMLRPDPKVLSAYKAICALAMELDKDLIEVVRVRDSMVPIDQVVGAAAAVVTIVLAEIRALPEAAALRVNPLNPGMAQEELSTIIAQVIASAQTQVDAQLTEILKLKEEVVAA